MLVYYSQEIVLNTISDVVWYSFHFTFLIKNCGKKTEWHFYNFPKLFLKDNNKDIIYYNSNNWGSLTLSNDAQFYTGVFPPVYSYCKLLDFNVNVWQCYWNG